MTVQERDTVERELIQLKNAALVLETEISGRRNALQGLQEMIVKRQRILAENAAAHPEPTEKPTS